MVIIRILQMKEEESEVFLKFKVEITFTDIL